MVTRKTEISPIDGTPEKRMYWSIISDYDLRTALCELVDNAIDLWQMEQATHPLAIAITLDADRQLITVHDNAGGVKHNELRLLIAPGGSRNDPSAEVIGIFGVGGKRASIALGEQVVIKTRYKKQQSYQIDITKDWVEHGDWEIPVYSIPNIGVGTTEVAISHLRKSFTRDDIEMMKAHLGETYARFLGPDCTITVNDDPVQQLTFDHWAYPQNYPPKKMPFEITFGGQTVKVTITAGLIADRDAEQENYGVYVYCNRRLIVKELRSRDVGYFVTTEAGVPHSDASLCRAILELQGPAKLMPWDSSKSGINPGHPIFQNARPALIQLVSYFTKLSRRLRKTVGEDVTPYTTGVIETITSANITAGGRLNLTELPHANRRHVEHLKTANEKILNNQPWTVGLVEAIAALDVIGRQRFDTRNRIALLLLDSNLEIALKEFIVHSPTLFPPNVYADAKIQQLFKNRSDVINDVVAKVPSLAKHVPKINHYYLLRNKLIHERATVGITDPDVENYRATVQAVLKTLFKLKFTE